MAARDLVGRGLIQVRRAREQDRAAILDLARRFHAELRLPGVPLNEASVEAAFSRVAAGEPAELGLVATLGDGEGAPLVGFLYAQGSRDLFLDLVAVTVVAFYVVPERRASTAALRLMRRFMRTAVDGGAEALSVHVATGIRMRQSDRFLTRLGFSRRGGNYLMLVKSPARPDKG